MTKAPPVGLMASVPLESALIRKEIRNARSITPSLLTGRLGGNHVAYITSGIGIANAAHAATLLIEGVSPRLVILFGIGGAYHGSALKKGDVALAEKEVYADTGVLVREGLRGLDYMGIPLLRRGNRRFYNDFPLDRKAAALALRLSGGGVRPGVFLTVSQCTGTLTRARALRRKYNAICENMEGASVAQICARYGVPLLELRGISNMVEDRNPDVWEKKLAATNCQKVVMEILRGL